MHIKKVLVLLIALLVYIVPVSAQTILSEEIPTCTYIIGKNMFTRDSNNTYNGTLTAQILMLASRSIDGSELSNMIIYYKKADGTWIEGLTNTEISVPEQFVVNRINLQDISDTCISNHRIITYVGDEQMISHSCSEIQFKSSNSDIVKVSSDGVITPLKIGKAIIIASSGNSDYEIEVYVDHERYSSNENEIRIYNVENATTATDAYDVYIKLPSESEYHKIQTLKARVAYVKGYKEATGNWVSSYASYNNFDFDGIVNVKVVPRAKFNSYRLRGNANYQNLSSDDGKILFDITSNGTISLEIGNDEYNIMENLQIFANKPDSKFDDIDINSENLIYVFPGEHKCKNGCTYEEDKTYMVEKKDSNTAATSYPAVVNLNSNQTLYVSGSAILHAQVKIDKWNDSTLTGERVENVNIFGRGTIDTGDLIVSGISSNNITFTATDSSMNSGLIRIIYAESINVDGVILKNSKSYNLYIKDSDDINVSDLKIISSGEFTDGIHILSSREINVENAFIRTCDDAIAVYASRGSGDFNSGSFVGKNGNTTGITFNNMLIWIDNGRSVYIGGHGNFDSDFGHGDVISDIHFTNLKILENRKRLDKEGVLTVGSRDNNYVKDIEFNNIEVDHIIEGNLITVKNSCSNYDSSDYTNTKANKCGYMINNVIFKNVNWAGEYDSLTNVDSWINITGKLDDKNEGNSVCTKDNQDHIVSLITFENVSIGSTILNSDNRSNILSGKPFYFSNNCVYNQMFN